MNRKALDGAKFRKANGSGDVGCVEVAITPGTIGMRDSKDRGSGPTLAFDEFEWKCFVEGVKNGEFDLPS